MTRMIHSSLRECDIYILYIRIYGRVICDMTLEIIAGVLGQCARQTTHLGKSVRFLVSNGRLSFRAGLFPPPLFFDRPGKKSALVLYKFCIYVYMCIYMYIYIYVYMCINIYVYVHM